jgi:hypothetical protein
MSSSQVVKNNLLKSETNQNRCKVWGSLISMETCEQAKNTFREFYEMASSVVCNVVGEKTEAKY